jgi:hypothetical protein
MSLTVNEKRLKTRQTMKIGMCAAAICFPIFLCLSWINLANVVPWLVAQELVKGIYVCTASLYLPMFPCIFAATCLRKKTVPAIRLTTGFMIGASFGIFICGWFAIFAEKRELMHFHTEQFEKILRGLGPGKEAATETVRTQFQRDELLAMLNWFLQSWVMYAITFGIISLLTILLYDLVSRSARKSDLR